MYGFSLSSGLLIFSVGNSLKFFLSQQLVGSQEHRGIYCQSENSSDTFRKYLKEINTIFDEKRKHKTLKYAFYRQEIIDFDKLKLQQFFNLATFSVDSVHLTVTSHKRELLRRKLILISFGNYENIK